MLIEKTYISFIFTEKKSFSNTELCKILENVKQGVSKKYYYYFKHNNWNQLVFANNNNNTKNCFGRNSKNVPNKTTCKFEVALKQDYEAKT